MSPPKSKANNTGVPLRKRKAVTPKPVRYTASGKRVGRPPKVRLSADDKAWIEAGIAEQRATAAPPPPPAPRRRKTDAPIVLELHYAGTVIGTMQLAPGYRLVKDV